MTQDTSLVLDAGSLLLELIPYVLWLFMVIASARSSLFICLGYGTTLDCLRMIVAAYCVRNHNAAHDVLVDMKLMQHAALSGYCSAPLKLVPVDGVKQSVVDYPFLDLDCCFKMYTWSFTCPF